MAIEISMERWLRWAQRARESKHLGEDRSEQESSPMFRALFLVRLVSFVFPFSFINFVI